MKWLLSSALVMLTAVSFCNEIFKGDNFRAAWNFNGSLAPAQNELSLSGDSAVGQMTLKRSVKDFEMEFDIKFLSFGKKTSFGFDFRNNPEKGLKLDISSGKIQLFQRNGKRFKTLASKNLNLKVNEWNKFKITVCGDNVKVEFAGISMDAKAAGVTDAGALTLIGIGPAKIKELSLTEIIAKNDEKTAGTDPEQKVIFKGTNYIAAWNPVGSMRVAGDKVQLQGNSAVGQMQLKNAAGLKNFILELEINFAAFGGRTTFGVDFRKSSNGVLKIDFNSSRIKLLQKEGKIMRAIAKQPLALRWNVWYPVKLYVNDKDIKIECAGAKIDLKLQRPADGEGLTLIGIGPAEIRNISVTALPEKKTPPKAITAPASKDELKVFVANGMYYHVFGTSAAELKSMGAVVAGERFLRYTGNGTHLTKEAVSSEILPNVNAVLLTNVDAPALNSSNFNTDDLEKFVRAGGGLVILGGQFSYGAGGYSGTALERLCPVETVRVFDRIKNVPSARIDAVLKDHPILAGVEFKDNPVVFWQHEVNIKPGSAVVLNAGDKPLLVVRRYGKGRVVAFLGTVWGDSETETPYWRSASWKPLLSNMLKWVSGTK